VAVSGIHLLLTYRCTYECDHCFLWGSPHQQGTLTLAQIRLLLQQARELGTVEWIYAEGGEPTLVYPVMVEALREAREMGFRTGLVTSCHFAEDVADAALWLRPLAELGLEDLALSSYPYRPGGLPRRYLDSTRAAARSLGLPVQVLDADPVLCKGRAAVKLGPGRASRRPAELTCCPHEQLASPGRLHVGSDGEAQLCQGLSLGNLWQRPLRAVLAAYRPGTHPVVRELLRGGPLELARAEGLQPLGEQYADECHLCYELRDRLRPRYPGILAPVQAYGGLEVGSG
jgi:hypothetical protein